MPHAIARPCRNNRCPNTTTDRSGYCDKHNNWDDWQNKHGSSAERGYGIRWKKIRKRIIERDSGLCQQCLKNGRIKAGNEVDHIKPKAKGGDDRDENLQTLCNDCHKKKTASESRN